jgi:hypothetical protein
MEHRVFGRELTNLLEQDSLRYKRNYSLMHHDKLKDLKAPVSTRNKSILIAKHQEPKPELPEQQMVPDYFEENIRYLISQEKTHPAFGNYIAGHKTVSETSRAKLIDWLAELHYKYKMFPETIFTVATLVDRYLSAKAVPLAELQLVGAAALYIAAKFEETYQVPQLKQLISACAGQYTSTQLLNMEADMLAVFGFDLIVNSSYKFYEPLAKVAGLEAKNMHLGQYVLELALFRPKFLEYSPSLMASACVYLIKKIRKCEQAWSEQMIKLVGYRESELKSCAKELCSLLEEAGEMTNCRSIKKKFSMPAYHEVTKIRLERKETKK